MNDLNAGFLLDIWHDLNAKRLAPVAIALVVALIAIPALMLKGSDGGGDVPLPVPVSGTNDGAQVVVADELAEDSKLDSYKSRDPFDGLTKGGSGKEAAVDGSASAPIDDLASKDDGSTGVSGSTGTGGSTDVSPPPSDGDSPTVAPDPPAKTPPVKKETAFYNFRLDLKWGRPGREKRIKSMSRLSFLSVSGHPVAIFLGVDETERNALFLVTPGLNHQGEGKCIPKPAKCNYLSLAEGKEHYLSANGHELRMELRDIKRVKATDDKKLRAVAHKASDDALDSYEPPALVDTVG